MPVQIVTYTKIKDSFSNFSSDVSSAIPFASTMGFTFPSELTDLGSQFTSSGFTSVLKKHHMQISMDSKGRDLDNIYVERLWRSLKYEDIYIKSYTTMKELKEGIKEVS